MYAIRSYYEEPLNLPDWFDTAVIVLLGIGFPIAVIMSWVYDVTPEGVVHEDGDPRPVQIDYGKIALGAVIVRITSYNVCYTKLLRPSIF